MRYFAHLEDGRTVKSVLAVPDIQDMHHPDIHSRCVEITGIEPRPSDHWTRNDDGTWSEPPPAPAPAPPPAPEPRRPTADDLEAHLARVEYNIDHLRKHCDEVRATIVAMRVAPPPAGPGE